jgi:LPS export ABC transporter protein LptC
MNHSHMKFRPYLFVSVIFLLSLIVISCENKVDFIPKSDFLSHPSVTAKNFQTIFTDSGKLQLILSAPLMEKYNSGEFPYTEFRFGMVAVYYNGKKVPVGSTTSKYARFNQTENLWILKDSVVVINESGDKLETELLYWDQTKDLIYTDRFVKITNEDQIIMGTGFESDPRLVKRRIKKVTATIYLKNEK